MLTLFYPCLNMAAKVINIGVKDDLIEKQSEKIMELEVLIKLSFDPLPLGMLKSASPYPEKATQAVVERLITNGLIRYDEWRFPEDPSIFICPLIVTESGIESINQKTYLPSARF